MEWYKGTKQQCKDYNNEVYNGCQKLIDDPHTNGYASITERNGDFYIAKHKDFPSDMEVVNELPQLPENEQNI